MTPAATGAVITEKLAELSTPSTLERIVVGTRLTRYEYRPMAKARARAILRTREDLALALGEPRLNVVVPVEGRPQEFAVEVPNEPQIVRLSDLMERAEQESWGV